MILLKKHRQTQNNHNPNHNHRRLSNSSQSQSQSQTQIMNEEELRRKMWFAYRKKAKQAVNKPPPSKLRLHHLIKQNEVVGDDPDDQELNFSLLEDHPFDDDVLLYYLTEYNCTEEVKSVMKMNLPRKDIGFLWFVSIEFGINYVVVEMVKSGFNTNECCRMDYSSLSESFSALIRVVNQCGYFVEDSDDDDEDDDSDDDDDDGNDDNNDGSDDDHDYHMWMDSIRFLLGLGVDVNFRERKDGLTALLVACRDSCLPVVKLLLEHGGDPKIIDDGGYNAWLWSCFAQNHDLILFWIERNVDINEQGNHGDTPLMLIVDTDFKVCNENTLHMAQLLLENGADVNIANNDGDTALMGAMLEGRGPEVVKLLLSHGANIDAQNAQGQTALMKNFVYNRDPELLTVLLNHGANIDAQDAEGRTALIMAAKVSYKGVKLLLEHGANVDIQDNDGDTALIIACEQGNKDIVELFLNHGADKDSTNKDGKTTLDFAKTSEIKDMILNYVDNTFVLK